MARTEPRYALVTGGTGGIGGAIAEGLARQGFHVIISGRSADTGMAIADRLGGRSPAPVRFEQADLTAQIEVEGLAERLGVAIPKLDVLVNCAAGVFAERRTSIDGIEYTLALNHLAPLLLTLRLETLLKRAIRARIIFVAADPVLLARQPPDPDDLEMKASYSGIRAYMRSKNLNVITAYRFAQLFADSGIMVNACHPGIVRTGLASNLGAGLRLAAWLARPFVLSPSQGADTPLWLATSEEVADLSGRFFVKRRERRSAPCTYDLDISRRVWINSLALIKSASVGAKDEAYALRP